LGSISARAQNDNSPDATQSTEGPQTCAIQLQGINNTAVSASADVSGDISALLSKLSDALKNAHISATLSVTANAAGNRDKACCDPQAMAAPDGHFKGSISGSGTIGATVSVPDTAFDVSGSATVTIHGRNIVGCKVSAQANLDQGTAQLTVTASGNDEKYDSSDKCNCLQATVQAALKAGIQFGPQISGEAGITIWKFHSFTLASFQLQGIVTVGTQLSASGTIASGKGCQPSGDGTPHGTVGIGPIQINSDLQGQVTVGPWHAQTIDWTPNKPITIWSGGNYTF
jgi:hypothetical protein